ncbi:Membrane-bound lytic murein transglycosylase B [compost metagenome]
MASAAKVAGELADSGLSPGLEATTTVGQLRTLGWTSREVLRDDIPVTAIRLEGAEGAEYWMGLPNFYVITRYNRSAMYAMAVYQLSEALVKARSANK